MMRVDEAHGKNAETEFRLLEAHHGMALIQARPLTGRTHQIRVHLACAGHPVVGDRLYGPRSPDATTSFGLRATQLSYMDPFTLREVRILAPVEVFLGEFGF